MAGGAVRHRSRAAADPSQPNLGQVHLIHAELFERLAGVTGIGGPDPGRCDRVT